ncbi:MAG: flagellar hook-length control protein FliK [Nitrospirae bacterium]|nr:flagellar hook-length control protein FliK [Nitrospirota bacterium]
MVTKFPDGAADLNILALIRGRSQREYEQGDIIEGQVIKLLDRHRALIDIRGLPISADTGGSAGAEAPLQPGDRVRLEIRQIHPRVVLSLVAREPGVMHPVNQRVRDLLPSRADLAEVVPNLLSKLGEIGSGEGDEWADIRGAIEEWVFDGEKADRPDLARIAESLGLRREALLRRRAESGAGSGDLGRDLRTFLKRVLEGAGKGVDLATHPDLAAGLKSLSDNLELATHLNAVPRSEGPAQLLPLLFHWATGEWADVRVYFFKPTPEAGKDQGEAAGERRTPLRVLIRLDMPSLGSIQVDALFSDRRLSATFYATEPATRDLIQAGAPALQSALEGLGWSSRLNTRIVRRENVEDLSDVQILIPEGHALVDVRA